MTRRLCTSRAPKQDKCDEVAMIAGVAKNHFPIQRAPPRAPARCIVRARQRMVGVGFNADHARVAVAQGAVTARTRCSPQPRAWPPGLYTDEITATRRECS